MKTILAKILQNFKRFEEISAFEDFTVFLQITGREIERMIPDEKSMIKKIYIDGNPLKNTEADAEKYYQQEWESTP